MSDSRDLAALGPFFAAGVVDPGTVPGAPWRPLRELADDPAALARRVDAVHAALLPGSGSGSAAQRRVTASAAQLGLVARVLAPAIGVAALGLGPVSIGVDDVWWQDRLGGPFPLLLRRPAGTITADGVTTDRPGIAGSVVEAVTEAVAVRHRVSPRVVWGNVASAAVTAARLVTSARPHGAAEAYAAADFVLADPRVEGGTRRSSAAFRRRSCCLLYRIAGGAAAVCDDCVLRRPA